MRVLNSIMVRFSSAFRRIYAIWLRTRLKNVGKEFSVNGKITIVNPNNVSIGSNCSLNHGVYLNAFNSISIGNDVTISANVSIVTTGLNYVAWFNSGEREHTFDGAIEIGNHVWIGCNATVLCGVKITGEYVVIGAGSVVTKDITESRVVVAGCPGKIIKRL